MTGPMDILSDTRFDPEPLIPVVTVNLAEGPQHGLDLVARVADELRGAGFSAAATAFEAVAQSDCDTHDDLLALIRSTVTVL